MTQPFRNNVVEENQSLPVSDASVLAWRNEGEGRVGERFVCNVWR